MTPQIDWLGKTSTVLRISTHIYCVAKDIGGKMFIFQLNQCMSPLKLFDLVKMSTVLRVSITHIWGFSGERWENVHFLSKPRHVTPQIHHLRKTSICSEAFNTHLWCFWGQRWENIYFPTKPMSCEPSNRSSRKNKPCSEDFNTHLWGFSGDRWENIHF